MQEFYESEASIIGNFGADPDVRYTASGKAVLSGRVATNKRVKAQNSDEYENRATWHNIVAWERDAEAIAEKCKKGDKIRVRGEMQGREWEDKNGSKHYTIEIVVRSWQKLAREENGSSFNRPPHPADNGYPASPTHTGAPQQQVDDDPPPF